MPSYNLENKVVLITGAGSGLGRATAQSFSREGSILAITDRVAKDLEDTAQQCIDIGLPASKVLTIFVDHSKEEDNIKTIDTTIEKFGQLDVLVNNAGLGTGSTIEGSTLAQYDVQMSVNAKALFHLTKLAVPHLRKTKGNIVNVSSIGGYRSFPSMSIYGMSKAVVDQLTTTSCIEFAKDGIRVNAVNPGFVDTNIVRRLNMYTPEQYQQFLDHMASITPLGKIGQATEVADLVTFLASEKACYITGATVPIDGGRGRVCPR